VPLTRWPALVSFCLGLALPVAATGFPAEPVLAHVGKRQGLTFQDTRPINLTWDDARDGLQVKFCNLDSDRARQVKDGLAGFRFKSAGEFVTDEQIWEDPGAKTPLGRGQCDELLLQVDGSQEVEAGTYTGMLVVTSGGSGGARRRVTVSVPGAEEKAASKATPLADDTSFTAKKWGPFDKVKSRRRWKAAARAGQARRPATSPARAE
jgi:hypothetical protein